MQCRVDFCSKRKRPSGLVIILAVIDMMTFNKQQYVTYISNKNKQINNNNNLKEIILSALNSAQSPRSLSDNQFTCMWRGAKVTLSDAPKKSRINVRCIRNAIFTGEPLKNNNNKTIECFHLPSRDDPSHSSPWKFDILQTGSWISERSFPGLYSFQGFLISLCNYQPIVPPQKPYIYEIRL